VKLRDYPTTPKSINQVFNEFSQEQNRQQRFTEEQTARRAYEKAQLEQAKTAAKLRREQTAELAKQQREAEQQRANIAAGKTADYRQSVLDQEDAKLLQGQGMTPAQISAYVNNKAKFAMDYAKENTLITSDGNINPEQFQHNLRMGNNIYRDQHREAMGQPRIGAGVPSPAGAPGAGGDGQPGQTLNEDVVQRALGMMAAGMTDEDVKLQFAREQSGQVLGGEKGRGLRPPPVPQTDADRRAKGQIIQERLNEKMPRPR